uniref:Uncharacterized protein n=1 Tax=Arundo donax TaxID=35708 RepID=A0A0A9FRE4_ARUDO
MSLLFSWICSPIHGKVVQHQP